MAGPAERRRQLLSAPVHRVILAAGSIRIEIKRSELAGLLTMPGTDARELGDELFGLVIPVQLKRRGVEAKLVIKAAGNPSAPPDAKLVALVAESRLWIDDLAQGRAFSIRDIARQSHRDTGEVSRTLPLAFLAPDIVEAILEGRQPVELTPRQLKPIGKLSYRRDNQRRSSASIRKNRAYRARQRPFAWTSKASPETLAELSPYTGTTRLPVPLESPRSELCPERLISTPSP